MVGISEEIQAELSKNPTLPRSMDTERQVAAPFSRWGSPTLIEPPWGRREYWSMIASQMAVGPLEIDNFVDNIFLHQSIEINELPEKGWQIRGRSQIWYSSFVNPAQDDMSIQVRVLLVLR